MREVIDIEIAYQLRIDYISDTNNITTSDKNGVGSIVIGCNDTKEYLVLNKDGVAEKICKDKYVIRNRGRAIEETILFDSIITEDENGNTRDRMIFDITSDNPLLYKDPESIIYEVINKVISIKLVPMFIITTNNNSIMCPAAGKSRTYQFISKDRTTLQDVYVYKLQCTKDRDTYDVTFRDCNNPECEFTVPIKLINLFMLSIDGYHINSIDSYNEYIDSVSIDV